MRFDTRVFYEITHNCNLSCVHCCNSTRNDVMKITCSDIGRFHKRLSSYGIRDSVLTGGEPTMHKDFFEIVKILSEYGNIIITTNGTYLSADEYIRLLKRYPNVLIQISLDGFSAESHDSIRGNGTFETVMNLVNQISKVGLSKQLCLSCVIMNNNIHEVKEMIEFSKQNVLESFFFPKLISSGRGQENWEKIAPTREEQIEIEMEIVRLIAENDESVSLNRLDHILMSLSGGICEKECISTIKVSPEGYIYPCPLSIGKENSIGNIFDFVSLEQLGNVLSKLKKGQFDSKYVQEFCSSCEFNSICMKNYCELCKFNAAAITLTNEEISYQCDIHRHYFNEITKEVEL